MEIGFAIFAIYLAAIAALVIGFEQPRKNRHRTTGRGGDFE
jgi:hypothetical protein